jgi:pimeloyl-ACP methyl ester carboxylesterase
LTGKRVDCPDLLGHGWAPHTPPYTIENLAKHLAANLAEEYNVIGGVSFGSTIAAALYPLLAHKPSRLVLAEPLLDHPAFDEEKIAGALNTTKNIPTEEEILKGNPTWIAAEATLRRMSLTQIDPQAIRQLFEVCPSPVSASVIASVTAVLVCTCAKGTGSQ